MTNLKTLEDILKDEEFKEITVAKHPEPGEHEVKHEKISLGHFKQKYSNADVPSREICEVSDLRQEAKKWIKEMKYKKENGFGRIEISEANLKHDKCCGQDAKKDFNGAIKILKYFFNIKEEDIE